VSIGLTATLPYWRVLSEGAVRFDNFRVAPPDSTGAVGSDLRSLYQTGLTVDWKTPWAVGAGAGWTTGDWQLHVATEYYAAVPRHTVLQTEPSGSQVSTGGSIEYTVVDERRPVLNTAVGARWNGSDRISLYGSVATNLSSVPDSVVDFTQLASTVNQTTHETNFVLLGLGVSVRTSWTDFTLGTTWQGGSDDQPRVASLPGSSPGGEPGDAMLDYQQWRFLAGFTIPSLGDLVDNVTGG